MQIKLHLWSLVALFMALNTPKTAQAQSSYSLEEALERARLENPQLKTAHHRIDEAFARQTTASLWLKNNPVLTTKAGPSLGGSPQLQGGVRFKARLMQRFEIGGQRGKRMVVAQSEIASAEAGLLEQKRQLEQEVNQAFYEAMAAKSRVQVRKDAEVLSQNLLHLAKIRLEKGAGTPLEVNAARIRRATAQRRVLISKSKQQKALLELRRLLALPKDAPFSLSGTLPAPKASDKENRAQLKQKALQKAFEIRPDLQQEAQRMKVAKANVALADAEAWPDVSAGVSYGYEEGSNIVLGMVQVPLPFFNRNQGERARSRAFVQRRQSMIESLSLLVETQVRIAFNEYEQALRSLHLYDDEVLLAQAESLSMLQRAFEAGEVGYAEVIVLQRDLLEAQEALIDVKLRIALAKGRILFAVGLSPKSTSISDSLQGHSS